MQRDEEGEFRGWQSPKESRVSNGECELDMMVFTNGILLSPYKMEIGIIRYEMEILTVRIMLLWIC